MNQEELNQVIAGNPFASHVGMELVKVEYGYAEGRIRMENHHTNIYGGMHGGCIYALADTVAGIAAVTCGRYVTTLNGGMNYMLPVKDTEYVNCKAKVIRQGGRIAVLDVVIENDKGDVLSNGSFQYYCVSKKLEDGHVLSGLSEKER